MRGVITEEYRKLNEELHATNEAYGVSGQKWAEVIERLATGMQTIDVLDYGSGKGTLAANLSFRINQYDPCVPGIADLPEPADLVACTDVLEHIEPELIDYVLDDIKRVTKRMAFFVISTTPAQKVLSDGRNAHLIQETGSWWIDRIAARFNIVNFIGVGTEKISLMPSGSECLVLVEAKEDDD